MATRSKSPPPEAIPSGTPFYATTDDPEVGNGNSQEDMGTNKVCDVIDVNVN